MNPKMNKLLVFFATLSQMVSGQSQFTAELKTVSSPGIYRLVLPTEIVSSSENNVPNFRIFDSKNQQVPFAFIDEMSVPKKTFNNFKIISRTSEPNKKSAIIFENANPKLDFLTLEIVNYSGEKTFSVSGSNDQKQWFGVLQPTVLDDLTRESFEVSKNLYLPRTNYKFLKIETIDKNSLPINIQKIGQYNTTQTTDEWTEIASKSIKINQLKSYKKTQIQVEFEDFEKIDKLQFEISAPSNYSRKIRLFEVINQKTRKRNQLVEVDFANFELTPNQNYNLSFQGIRAKKFFIEIDNKDNPPLEIQGVKCYQKSVVVLASLKANKVYVLKTQNQQNAMPTYDLSEFKNIDADEMPNVAFLKPFKTEVIKSKTNQNNFWNSPNFLWICIGIATIAVLFFVFGLMKEVKKSA